MSSAILTGPTADTRLLDAYCPPVNFKEIKNRKTTERHIINFQQLGILDVLSLGRYEYHVVQPGLTQHAHPHSVEICYLERGYQIYRAGNREYRLVGGDVFVTGPGEPHDTGGHPEDCGILYWLILHMPKKGGSLLMLPPDDSAVLAYRLSHLPDRHFSGRPALKGVFRRLFELEDQAHFPLKRTAVINQLLSCIFEVLDCSDRHLQRCRSSQIQRVVAFIEASTEEQVSLEELAEKAGLSLSRFKARFKAEVGVGPHEFALRARIAAAKKALLDESLSVTDVAMRYGFSSSQYFVTVFGRFTRMTPGRYRSSGGKVIPLLRDANLA